MIGKSVAVFLRHVTFIVVIASTLGGIVHAGTIEVVDCVFPETVELGDRAYLQVLVVNNDDEPITVFDPRWVAPGKHWGDDVMGQGRVHGRWIPHRIVEPGEIWYFSVDAPFARETGDFAAQAEMCLVHGKVEPLVILAAQDATTDEERNEAYLKFKKIRVDPCSALDGERKVFKATWKVVQPTGKDKAYFDKYLRDWVESGDTEVRTRLKEKLRERWRELEAKNPTPGPYAPPFSELKQRQSFKELEDNRYAALAGYGGGGKVELLDYEKRFLSAKGGYRFDDDSPAFSKLVFSFEKARYYVDKYNLRWGSYLGAAVSLFGTSKENDGLDAVQRVASESPDCVQRYLAKRVLEIYAEVRGSKGQ